MSNHLPYHLEQRFEVQLGATHPYRRNFGNNMLIGTDGNDLLCGEVGDNTIWGGKGNDRLNGGSDINRL